MIRKVKTLLLHFPNYKQASFYGFILALLLIVLRQLELHFLLINHLFELYTAGIAVIFTGLGIWLAVKLTKPAKEIVTIEKERFVDPDPFEIDQNELARLGISKREIEVLQLIAQGLSNEEIADKLFISVSTVKTHSVKLFDKMDVRRRTQAIEKAKRLKIIA
ncbi:DNA-binding response regulator [Pedobacter sp. HMF7647]|uniref:DNA-binding response regulator n=1 Tax=Hufsiella arboris TaxID=2695275 RepID=A0A7K1Y6J9_9SPHI|nr:LuxR C-terminal-related transcriptional regulator [Hufsiella arboris]MXV50197.1 DNA-binding response regulator [Hufsiella arboris]